MSSEGWLYWDKPLPNSILGFIAKQAIGPKYTPRSGPLDFRGEPQSLLHSSEWDNLTGIREIAWKPGEISS
jgi:hypothetical protein